jgi:monoamine oxidase
MTSEVDLVIIGAGAAGVGAARRLASEPLSILLIEASARVGGRAWTQTIAGTPLDLGCGWLHSGERNPWTAIAEASGFAVERGIPAWGDHYRDLGFSPDEQAEAEKEWRDWRDRLDAQPFASDRASDALPKGGRWAAYAQSMSGYVNGAELEILSIADYLAYDRAASENNWRAPAGYGSLVAASLPPVPLRLATPATAIDWTGPRVRIETRAGVLTARAVLLTVSTHVLASGAIRFRPALDEKLHAAACLPLGYANKLFLSVDEGAAFEAERHLLGDPRRAETGSYYIRPFGRPVVECFYGGPGARALERAGLEEAFEFARDELAALFGSAIRPRLRALTGSYWGLADEIGGSYSHALPGESRRRTELAAPLDEKLFFAGEATHPSDFSTAHGAFASGVRAADQALAALGRKPIVQAGLTGR